MRCSTRPSRSSARSATLDLKAIEFEGSDSLDNPSAVQAENKGASEGSETP